MNTMMRWNPWTELAEQQNRLASFFNRALARTDGEREEAITVAEWAPLVDITEDDHGYVIKAELPEIRREDVKVTVENGVLSISGERKLEKDVKGLKHHRIERAYGCFTRHFTVPDDAEGEKVTAKFKDGVLLVHLPKSEKARPRTVEVNIA